MMRLVNFLFPFWRAAVEGRWYLLRVVVVLVAVVVFLAWLSTPT
jgi:hypothetical protein